VCAVCRLKTLWIHFLHKYYIVLYCIIILYYIILYYIILYYIILYYIILYYIIIRISRLLYFYILNYTLSYNVVFHTLHYGLKLRIAILLCYFNYTKCRILSYILFYFIFHTFLRMSKRVGVSKVSSMQGYYRLNTTILSDTYNISTTYFGLYGHRHVRYSMRWKNYII